MQYTKKSHKYVSLLFVLKKLLKNAAVFWNKTISYKINNTSWLYRRAVLKCPALFSFFLISPVVWRLAIHLTILKPLNFMMLFARFGLNKQISSKENKNENKNDDNGDKQGTQFD